MRAESFGMIADGPTEMRKAVRLCCREGVDNVKINISGDEFVSTARAEITTSSARTPGKLLLMPAISRASDPLSTVISPSRLSAVLLYSAARRS